MKRKGQTFYTTPTVEMVELKNESGFAQSAPSYDQGEELEW